MQKIRSLDLTPDDVVVVGDDDDDDGDERALLIKALHVNSAKYLNTFRQIVDN